MYGVGVGLGAGEMQHGHPRLWLPGTHPFRCLYLTCMVDMCAMLVVKCFEFHPWEYGNCLEVRQNWV